MRCNEFGECRQMMCLLARILNRGPGDRLPRNTSGEQPFLWTRRLPVAAQYIQQLGRQHHVSVFTAFAQLNANYHSSAVDSVGSQLNSLRDAQAGGVAGRQDDAMFSALHAIKKM